jgi:hypothetical protein
LCGELLQVSKKNVRGVSEPVEAVPSQPINVPKKGYKVPVRAKARPRVVSKPQKRATKARPISAAIVIIGKGVETIVYQKT